MRATQPTGRPSPPPRSRWPGPSVRDLRQEKGPARAGPFFVLLSFLLPRLAACRPPARAGLARRRRAAGGAAALGRRALLRSAPLLRRAALLRSAALARRGLALGSAALLGGAPLRSGPLRCASLPRSGLTLAGPCGLPRRRLALAGCPLAAAAAGGLHLGDAFLFLLLLLFDLGLLAHQGLHLRLYDFHLPWELTFFDA